uniref:Ribonuclease P protein subunit p29 n=1 Tax=Globodera rostochiensis TaxID=31243 RepID=A0A914I6Q0_GLORO
MAELDQYAEKSVKIFNFEKQRRRERPIRRRAPENLLRRAGGLKRCADLRYDQFTSLYRLWLSYFKKVLEQLGQRIDERLLRVDYHGALLRVADAPNKTQIGLHGIVLHESKSTFQMITKRNRLIVIAKEDAVFQFVVDGKLFTLFGNAMRQRTHLRGRKAKMPTTIPFLLN